MARAEQILRPVFLFLLLILAPIPAAAQCLSEGAGERLSNYCLLNEMSAGGAVNYRAGLFIDNRLKSEGYSDGLGLPGSALVDSSSLSFFAQPILRFEENINGGNPAKPLVLGSLSFDGDEEFYRERGLLAGLGVSLTGRHIYGEGRYLNFGANGSYAHSPEYKVGIATTGASICSINHIKNWWNIDACVTTSRVRKDLTDETNSNLSVVGSHIFAGGPRTYHQASVGINRYFAENYTQNQITAGFDTIYANGLFTGFDVTLGELLENELVTRYAVSAQIGTQIASKPLTLAISYSDARGGLLLGFERDEQTYSVSASYPLWRNLKATIGYKETDSTIDYFDESTPTFSLQFASTRF